MLICFCVRLFIDALWSPTGKGLSPGCHFYFLIVKLSLSHWYSGSGVVHDCTDSLSLPSVLLKLFYVLLPDQILKSPIPFVRDRALISKLTSFTNRA